MRACAVALVLAAAANVAAAVPASAAVLRAPGEVGAAWRTDVAGQTAAPLARLDLVDRGQGPEAWAVNLLSGPVEVMLRADGPAPRSQPSLPARATVPALGRVLVARLAHADAGLRLEVVPGHPGARPRDVEYAWPLATRTLDVTQGWGGRTSHHDDENRHAVDFAVPEGTPVLAARDGVVMQAEGRFASGRRASRRDAERANFVRILHEDGTMAVYAHLAPGGVDVRPGERVRRGQRIGTSGSSGYSGGPHLHFAVQANRGLRLVALPFRMFGPGGVLRFSDSGNASEVDEGDARSGPRPPDGIRPPPAPRPVP